MNETTEAGRCAADLAPPARRDKIAILEKAGRVSTRRLA
jgi:hypothetical protein